MSDHLHALTHALNLILLANPSPVVSVSLCLTLYNGSLTSSWQRVASLSSEVLCKLTVEREERLVTSH